MKQEAKYILHRLEERHHSAAFRQLRKLAESNTVSVDTFTPKNYTAADALGLWLVRQGIAISNKRRFTGLSGLVRSLQGLPGDTLLTQAELKDGLTTGAILFLADTGEPIGAVISVRTEKDVARSWANYERAMGLRSADDLAA